MTVKTTLRQLNAYVRSGPSSCEVEDELRFHIEMRTRDNIAAGMTMAPACPPATDSTGTPTHQSRRATDIEHNPHNRRFLHKQSSGTIVQPSSRL